MLDIEQEYSEYVGVPQACAILQVSRATLSNYVSSGRLTRFQQGAPLRVVFKRSQLEQLKRVKPKYQ